MHKLVKRYSEDSENPTVYEYIENFETYEFTQCVVYEMAIRNNDVKAMIKEYDVIPTGYNSLDEDDIKISLLEQQLLDKYFIGTEVLSYIKILNKENAISNMIFMIKHLEANNKDVIKYIEKDMNMSHKDYLVHIKMLVGTFYLNLEFLELKNISGLDVDIYNISRANNYTTNFIRAREVIDIGFKSGVVRYKCQRRS